MITVAINNSRNNNGLGLGQLSASHLALGALPVLVQNISPRKTAGLLEECSKSCLLRCRNPAAQYCSGTGTRSALLMRGNLEVGGGEGGKDALEKGRGRPLTFRVALFYLGRGRVIKQAVQKGARHTAAAVGERGASEGKRF